MRTKAMFAGLLSAGFLGALSPACGSATPSDGGGGDSGPVDDSSGGAVPGLDAIAQTVGFPPKCEECIGKNCGEQFEACLADDSCKSIEICTGKCIEKQGMAGLSCLTSVCTDGGPLATDVSALNECITGDCATECNP
jgi:hypothetical protein